MFKTQGVQGLELHGAVVIVENGSQKHGTDRICTLFLSPGIGVGHVDLGHGAALGGNGIHDGGFHGRSLGSLRECRGFSRRQVHFQHISGNGIAGDGVEVALTEGLIYHIALGIGDQNVIDVPVVTQLLGVQGGGFEDQGLPVLDKQEAGTAVKGIQPLSAVQVIQQELSHGNPGLHGAGDHLGVGGGGGGLGIDGPVFIGGHQVGDVEIADIGGNGKGVGHLITVDALPLMEGFSVLVPDGIVQAAFVKPGIDMVVLPHLGLGGSSQGFRGVGLTDPLGKGNRPVLKILLGGCLIALGVYTAFCQGKQGSPAEGHTQQAGGAEDQGDEF